MKMETDMHDEGNEYSEIGGNSKRSEASDSCIVPISGEHDHSRTRKVEEEKVWKEEKTSNQNCSIEVKSGGNENSKAEKVCRICHLSSESSSGVSELIKLGCDCKGDLSYSHRYCADAWFLHKGNSLCEICGTMARNVLDNTENTSIFMMEWDEMRAVAATLDASRESSHRCNKQSFCNFLLACLVLAFVLPWFFRGIDIL